MLTQCAKLRLIRLAQKYLDKSPERTNCGYYNGFYKLTESVAIKTRHDGTKEKQIIAQVEMYERAKAAYSIGCGPYAFGLFYHPEFGMCYMVEIVKIFNKMYDCYSEDKYKNDFYGYNSDHARNRETKVGKRVNHIIRKMHYKIGFGFRDAHGGNLAVAVNGNIVCIDFDDFGSFSKCDLEWFKIEIKTKQ